MLQSVEIPAVTQARASGDYQQGVSDQWSQLGTTAMFAWALGVAPTKDNFWSTNNAAGQAANSHYNRTRSGGEPYSRLQAAVSTLTRGPVAPSDQNGQSDVPLIMRSCAKDGRLLQLDQPAFALDAQLRQSALHDGSGPSGHVWAGYSRVAGRTYGVLFAARLQTSNGKAYSVGPAELSRGFGAANAWTAPRDASFVAYEANATGAPFNFSAAAPITLAPKGTSSADSPADFSFWNVAPVFPNGWALLGEQDKWISVSSDRFTDVTTLPTGLVVKLVGSPGEVVNVAFKAPGSDAPVIVSCTVGQSSTVKIVSGPKKCAEW